ncbi:MAG: DUF2889 domain-containing protein [Acidimicrobiia bacterium]|nr:DUF2889 domain-containing protein [Acidimicrobiia bacterium]
MTTSGGAPTVRRGDPTLPYRRRIRLLRLDDHTVWGGLEDDFHHFEVTLTHRDAVVTDVTLDARRWPWTTCPDAGANLSRLIGMTLSERCTAVAEITDPRWQCTHQFDLAGLCVSHAARGDDRRQYDVELAVGADVVRPRLWRDGELVHDWTLGGGGLGRVLVAPAPFTEAPWKGGFIRWADQHLEPFAAEAAIVLRRACDIGMGRGMDLEAIDTAEELAAIMTGVCYSMQATIMPVAFRQRGTIRDFGNDADALLDGRP